MRSIQLDEDAITKLFQAEQVGRLASLDANGFPYVTPVNFAWLDGVVYVHTSVRGERLANIRRDSRVGFEVDAPGSLVTTDRPCNTSINYSSVIVRGTAEVVEDPQRKLAALAAIVDKYVPQHPGRDLPEAAVHRTTVLAITPVSCTGKQHFEDSA